MKKLPVARHLSDAEYTLLLKVYASHNRSMGLKERKKYSLSDIVKVVSTDRDSVLEVHYANGEWWHYTKEDSWF